MVFQFFLPRRAEVSREGPFRATQKTAVRVDSAFRAAQKIAVRVNSVLRAAQKTFQLFWRFVFL